MPASAVVLFPHPPPRRFGDERPAWETRLVLYSNLPKALITGITGQAGAGLTESLLTTGYAGQSTAAPGLDADRALPRLVRIMVDADLERARLAAPGAGRRILAERFGDWHRWDGQVTSMEQAY